MGLVQATESWSFDDPDGVPRGINEGDVFQDDAWAVKKWPNGFKPLEVRSFPHENERPVEEATAKPGEKRKRSKAKA